MATRRGLRKYTERANRQDQADAMRGEIHRGLVEIITNADDAYMRAGTDGPIRITVEHLSESGGFVARLRVADKATGLTADEMEAKLTRAGSRSSGFEHGQSVRGLHSRGVGDVAGFGSIEVESLKGGKWSKFVLEDLSYEIEDEPADSAAEIRARLGLDQGDSGATVTINVKGPRPVPSNLFDRLCNLGELRHITTDRTVTFEETGIRVQSSRRIYYDEPPCTEAIRKEVVVPGYPEALAELVVFEMDEPQDGQVNSETHHGLLIRGRRAVYENTLFNLDRKVGSGYLRGWLSCPYIDDLIRDFDDRQETGRAPTGENPIRLVSRSRDGLHDEHPFVRKLRALFSEELIPLIQDLAKRHAGERPLGDAIQERLDETAREFARLLADDLAELEVDEGNGSGGDEAPLKIIPGRVLVRPGEKKTLTVHIRPSLIPDGWADDLNAITDTPTIVSIDGEPDPPEPHPDNPEVLVSRVRVLAAPTEGNAIIRVSAGSTHDSCTVTVDSTVQPPPPPPEDLEFSHSHYNLRLGRRRSIEVRAPLDLVVALGAKLQLSLDGDPTIKVLTETCDLRLDPGNGWYVGRIPLVGDEVGASGELVAILGAHNANAHVQVLDPTDPHGLDLQIKWSDSSPKLFLPHRASLEQGPSGLVLTIYGQHPTIYPLLGAYDEDRRAFQYSQTLEVSLVLAEIMATELVHYLLEREFARPGQWIDASRYSSRYRSRLGRYLGKAQQMLSSADQS